MLVELRFVRHRTKMVFCLPKPWNFINIEGLSRVATSSAAQRAAQKHAIHQNSFCLGLNSCFGLLCAIYTTMWQACGYMFVLLAGTRARTIFFWVDPRATEIFLTTTFRIAGFMGSCLGRKLCVCTCAQASAFHIVGSCTLIVLIVHCIHNLHRY